MTPETKDALFRLAISQAPAVISGLKDLFRRAHPDLPQPTSEDIIATELHVFTSSLAKDDMWLAAHPEPPADPTLGPA